MGPGNGIALALALVLPQEAEPGRWEPVPLATPEQFLGLPEAPCLNRLGQVLFHGVGLDGRAGLFLSLGGSCLPVVRVGDLIRAEEGPLVVEDLGRHPGFNEHGAVAFQARLGQGQAILVRDGVGGLFEFVADSGEAFREFGGWVQINAAGEVLFRATVDPPGHPDRDDGPARWAADEEEPPPPLRQTRDGWAAACHAGLFLDTAEGLEVAARTTGQFLDLGEDFALGGGEVLVYRAWRQGVGECLLRVTAYGPPVIVAESRRFPALHEFSVNQGGTVVFRATDGEGRPCLGYSRRGQVGAQLLPVEEEEHPELGPGVCVGEDGSVLCVVRSSDQDRLLLRTPAGRWQEVLRSGREAWPGARIARIAISGQALAPSGRIVVRVTLAADGGEALLLLMP